MFIFKSKCITPLWGRQELCDVMALSDLLCVHDSLPYDEGRRVRGGRVEIWKSTVELKEK